MGLRWRSKRTIKSNLNSKTEAFCKSHFWLRGRLGLVRLGTLQTAQEAATEAKCSRKCETREKPIHRCKTSRMPILMRLWLRKGRNMRKSWKGWKSIILRLKMEVIILRLKGWLTKQESTLPPLKSNTDLFPRDIRRKKGRGREIRIVWMILTKMKTSNSAPNTNSQSKE